MDYPKPKWIIEDDCLIIGKCQFHKELAIDHSKVKGGGWYHIDTDNKSITLYGSSDDFGYAHVDDIKRCLQLGNIGTFTHEQRMKDWEVKHTTRWRVEDATDIVVLQERKAA